MKAFIKDILFGIVVFIVVMVMEFLVTLPFGTQDVWALPEEEYRQYLNLEFLLTAIPAGLVTYLFARWQKPDQKAGWRKAWTWTLIAFVMYFAIGIGNGNLEDIFGVLGIYVMLAFMFAGPLIYVLFNDD
ncbi:hypothetical protein [Jeotgalibacillus haloalkalitolerans]|uniref:Uncharacterized protein n=1 Tax=Jeotgalibacillus haloalkalitolerans TaxID=3104292 RepID=A0ABU5KIQ3_9BACL|nr:hypothetical protein [Jeotgalibacillus sp. HH7-29]MDZ5710801.1 hypothetical protein [Jeotgalibacillus sp. HH7-29]